ncbi:hypothetical protein [Photobacterium sanguinicancri]|uniref:hypothetical protein n=1 Tax=Photobacterium sanguinicancri TaxID=875932 RepID=UPI0021C26AE8|nr:hypothetical protein [Photobacterium sanguinicancri]
MKLSRRSWNNVIIFAVIIFIAVIQLPTLIKEKYGTAPSQSTLSALLPEQAVIEQLVLPDQHYVRLGADWRITGDEAVIHDDSVIMHWATLAGTPVDDATMAKLKPQLTHPVSVEIWLQAYDEPVRVTVYQLPQFWLLKNWQSQWLAVSVEPTYLFPSQ